MEHGCQAEFNHMTMSPLNQVILLRSIGTRDVELNGRIRFENRMKFSASIKLHYFNFAGKHVFNKILELRKDSSDNTLLMVKINPIKS
jgi:hypothetical protein